MDKQAEKQQAMVQQVAAATDSRQRTELEAALKNEEHKQRQLQQVAADFAALLAGERGGLSEGRVRVRVKVRASRVRLRGAWMGTGKRQQWFPTWEMFGAGNKTIQHSTVSFSV